MANPAPDRATLAKRVRQARDELGLTQKEFAARLGSKDYGLIIRWEGKRDPARAVEPQAAYREKLSRLTGKPPEWFSLARPAEREADYATRGELEELRAVLVEMLPFVPEEHRSVLEARLRAAEE